MILRGTEHLGQSQEIFISFFLCNVLRGMPLSPPPITKKFPEGERENECQISQNCILHMTCLEFHLYNHNSCEM